MKAFIVNSKDLFDSKKNPKLSLSAREIWKNKKIPKKILENTKGSDKYDCRIRQERIKDHSNCIFIQACGFQNVKCPKNCKDYIEKELY